MKNFLSKIFLIFYGTYVFGLQNFDQNDYTNKISFEIGKGDQFNYNSNGFIWIPKLKYSNFHTIDFGKGFKMHFNYGVKIDKYGIKLDSTNLRFYLKDICHITTGVYRNILSQTRVAGITFFFNKCNYVNFFIGFEHKRRCKYLLDKNDVDSWKERKYGTKLEDFILPKKNEDDTSIFPPKYGRLNVISFSPVFSTGLIFKDKNDKINFCLGGIYDPLSVIENYFNCFFMQKMFLTSIFSINKIAKCLERIEFKVSYSNKLGEYSKYHLPQKFEINNNEYVLPVSYIYDKNKNINENYVTIILIKNIGIGIKTVFNITSNFTLNSNLDLLHYMYNAYYFNKNTYDSFNLSDNFIKDYIKNLFLGNLNFAYTIPHAKFFQIIGGAGVGLINKIKPHANEYGNILLTKNDLKIDDWFWNFRLGFSILLDKVLEKIQEKQQLFLPNTVIYPNLRFLYLRYNITSLNYGLKIKQELNYGRNPWEYYRRGWSHPLDLYPYCNISFGLDDKNTLTLETCMNLNNKFGHGWEKENWIFRCVDKINIIWSYNKLLNVFAGYGESVSNNFTKVWRIGLNYKISDVVSFYFNVEKPRKSWIVQRDIHIINNYNINGNTKNFYILDINDYKNCDDSFLTGLKHPGFSLSFDFNFKNDIYMKIGTMLKPFNENKDGMKDNLDWLKGIIYFETMIKGFSLKCTLNRAAGCYTIIDRCNCCCGGFGFIPPEFCIGYDTYYQNSIYIEDGKKWYYIEKEDIPEIYEGKENGELKQKSLIFFEHYVLKKEEIKNEGEYNFENLEKMKKKYEEIIKKKGKSYNQEKFCQEKLKNVEPNSKKIKYITTLDFQIMYSFKLFKKRNDTFFIRFNYLRCFTKYDKVFLPVQSKDIFVENTSEIFYKKNFFQSGTRTWMAYGVIGTNIFIKSFIKIFAEISFGFMHRIVDDNLLIGAKIGFECDLSKKYKL